ncbi:ricin-type beta-trefoil lectin domain protein [Streptomyces sp. NPDC086989]|uniref:ricin-type beta-trefoil lectin domain protein n=1 Tax=Streptomyces sp. NPDC086989 TaxID=3365764 RepID=UPI0037F5BC6E
MATSRTFRFTFGPAVPAEPVGRVTGFGNKCLDVQGGGTGNGTPVETDACNCATAQQWQGRADGSVLNPWSGRCPDARGVVDTNCTAVQLGDCYGSANQFWHAPA